MSLITRISTWGWVLGDTLSGHFWPIAKGGVWQTVVRGQKKEERWGVNPTDC